MPDAHANSPRRPKPFVALNCAALNENLLDDEMFGHEEGAYTGSKGQRKGRFEHAHGGTFFLDEIGDMPLALQAKLLRVLENGEVVRIGANDPIKVDVRIVAATNRDIQKEVESGRFRQDLFFRLSDDSLPTLRAGKTTAAGTSSRTRGVTANRRRRSPRRCGKAFETTTGRNVANSEPPRQYDRARFDGS